MSIQQKAYIGIDCLSTFHAVLKDYKPKKVFLVRGKKSYQLCGAEQVIDEALEKITSDIMSFHDFEENPKIEDVEKGLSLLADFNPDLIIAIGGGSVLDISKLIRFFHSYEGDPTGNKFEKRNNLIPLLALPTTAGTGCETTHFSVMYKDKVKYSVEHDDILPDYAFIYPPFTYNNPPYLTACTGFDALAQGIEAYWNVNATEESDEYAIKAIQLLWSNLPIAVNSPTEEIRNKVAEGAYWAGRAINITKTTAPHAFSYPFTTYYGYPHGHAVALTFPYFLKWNLDAISNKSKKYHLLMLLNMNEQTSYKDMKKYLLQIQLDMINNNINLNNIIENVNISRLRNNPVLIDREHFFKNVFSL